MMLELGMFSWFGYQLSFERRLSLIRGAGFASTCLWLGSEEEEVRAGRADFMPSLVQENGLILDNVHAPYSNCNKLWSASSTDVHEAFEEYRASLLFCRNHAVPIMVMHVTEGDDPPAFNAGGLSAIKELVGAAEGYGVRIAIENTRRFDYLDRIFSNVQSPGLGFCYDSSHDFMAGKSKGRLLQAWSDRLATTHLSDSKQGTVDDHLVPGDGTIDWPRMGDNLRQRKYQGTLMLEVAGGAGAPKQFLARCHTWLAEFRNSVSMK